MNPDQIAAIDDGRPVVFRDATVLTMDEAGIIDGGDVLVIGETIAAVGRDLEVPEGAVEVDASGGIVMPGMVDTHRHMWQTALRGLGADWTLSQYFVFYYLTWGKIFRPEDVHAGNVLSAIEAVDSGVTGTSSAPPGSGRTARSSAVSQAASTPPVARSACSSPSTSPPTRSSRRRRRSRPRASWGCGSPPMPVSGAPPTTRASR
jgi:cytosine/adenosine deaminase-related metal-dependent hydrolase